MNLKNYALFENKSYDFYNEFIQLNEIIEEYTHLLPSGTRLNNLKINNKSIDVRFIKSNLTLNFIVVRNGLYLPDDETCNLEIGSYQTILKENGDLIDEMFDLYYNDEGLIS